uniref:Uncharacterized protein n=1 Tax=Ascaris lumbricoides TaxID=6252 RepID=A0A9J2P3X2_ASCLU
MPLSTTPSLLNVDTKLANQQSFVTDFVSCSSAKVQTIFSQSMSMEDEIFESRKLYMNLPANGRMQWTFKQAFGEWQYSGVKSVGRGDNNNNSDDDDDDKRPRKNVYAEQAHSKDTLRKADAGSVGNICGARLVATHLHTPASRLDLRTRAALSTTF